MPALNKFKNPLIAFDPKIVVYVEGPDDEFIFEHRLFSGNKRYNNIVFRVATRADGAQIAGCKAVVSQVTARLDDRHEIVFGIVDRDATFHDPAPEKIMDVFLEIDDNKFKDKAERLLGAGKRVYCLTRWELENYLMLDPEVVEMALVNYPGRDPQERLSPEEITETLIHHASTLLPLFAANIAMHIKGEKKLDKKYDFTRREDMRDYLINKNFVTEPELDQWLPRIEAFAGSDPGQRRELWQRLNRIVDGKIFMRRVFGNGPKDTKSLCARLAHTLASMDRVDSELKKMIEMFVAQAKDLIRVQIQADTKSADASAG